MRQILKLLQPMQRKLQQVVSRGVVRLVNDSLKMQEMQLTLMADETLDGVERFQNYGLTSVPHSGAEAITVSVSGHRSHSVAIVVDDRRFRLKGLANGEVALYDDQGQKVHLKRDGYMHVIANAQMTINAPLVRIEGELEVTGDIIDRVDTTGQNMNGMRETYNTHTHPGDSGGTTSQPNQGMGG